MPVSSVLHSIKAFIAAALALGIALHCNLVNPYWAMSTVYIVSNPLSGASASKAAYRMLGTLIGGAMTVVMIPALANSPELLSAGLIGWVALCAYISQLDQTPRSYVFQLAGYTVLVAGLPIIDSPTEAFSYVVSRVEEIGLAIICAGLVNRIIFPDHVGPVVVKQINKWMDNVTQLAADIMRGQLDVEKTRREWLALSGGMVSMRTLVTHVAYDASHHRELAGLLRGLQNRIRKLPPILSAIEDHVSQLAGNPRAEIAVKPLLEHTGSWVADGTGSSEENYRKLLTEAHTLEKQSLTDMGTDLLTASLAHRTRQFIAVWHECSVLYEDLRQEKVSSRSQKLMDQTGSIKFFRDHGLGLEAAIATIISIAVPLWFWFATAWPLGMVVAQMSGVFCCRWIGIDNPVFVLRKTVHAVVITGVVALVLNFTVLTTITDYGTLLAVLGLLLIPAASLRATITQRLMGILFCVFLPIMLGIETQITDDFQSLLTADLGLVFGTTCCLIIINLVKKTGAEARAHRLLHTGWRIVADMADNPTLHHGRRLQRLLDLVSFWASRQVALAPDSPLRKYDLLRDLRMGNNLIQLQNLTQRTSQTIRRSSAELCGAVARFYRKGQRDRDRVVLMEKLEKCWREICNDPNRQRSRRMQALLIAMQLCLGPGQTATEPAVPVRRPLWELSNA